MVIKYWNNMMDEDTYAKEKDQQIVSDLMSSGLFYNVVNHPSHYTSHPSGLEAIEITKHESFCIGNAIKYIWRHRDKGKPVEDLEKAIFYLKEEIKLIKENDDSTPAGDD